MVEMAKNLELWETGRLVPYAKNARTHSDEQVSKIAASITEFGFTNPILVDSSDGIIAGHGRLMAAQSLGIEKVPVIVLDHLTDAQRRAYILADNRLALDASWDEDLLSEELTALSRDGFDMALTGFDEDELSDLIDNFDSDFSEISESKNADEVTEVEENAVSVLGDIWILGNHRLICGSSVDLVMELEPKYVDVILKKWQEYTGKSAIHKLTGKDFSTISSERV